MLLRRHGTSRSRCNLSSLGTPAPLKHVIIRFIPAISCNFEIPRTSPGMTFRPHRHSRLRVLCREFVWIRLGSKPVSGISWIRVAHEPETSRIGDEDAKGPKLHPAKTVRGNLVRVSPRRFHAAHPACEDAPPTSSSPSNARPALPNSCSPPSTAPRQLPPASSGSSQNSGTRFALY